MTMAQNLVDLGADSICVKDMAGILTPFRAFELVSELKKRFQLPVQMHTHYTSGMASMMYLKAIEAGADVIDTSISSLALGTSQPATETMVATLAGTPFDTGLNLEALSEVAQYFKEVRKGYKEFDVYSSSVDTNVLLYQVPGGMLSNFMSQLQQQEAMDRFAEVLAEVPRVREELGFPPLVTPTSQIVGSQALLNVLLGRYKMVTTEVRSYVKGMYGATPVPIKEDIKKQILRDQEPITCRPADILEPELPQAREEIGDYAQKEEDILSYTILPQVAKKFLIERNTSKGVELEAKDNAEVRGNRHHGGNIQGAFDGVRKPNLVDSRDVDHRFELNVSVRC
jgi:oxaloacetate decarboxylase alpha subunit